jgi:hypothetical protein
MSGLRQSPATAGKTIVGLRDRRCRARKLNESPDAETTGRFRLRNRRGKSSGKRKNAHLCRASTHGAREVTRIRLAWKGASWSQAAPCPRAMHEAPRMPGFRRCLPVAQYRRLSPLARNQLGVPGDRHGRQAAGPTDRGAMAVATRKAPRHAGDGRHRPTGSRHHRLGVAAVHSAPKPDMSTPGSRMVGADPVGGPRKLRMRFAWPRSADWRAGGLTCYKTYFGGNGLGNGVRA